MNLRKADQHEKKAVLDVVCIYLLWEIAGISASHITYFVINNINIEFVETYIAMFCQQLIILTTIVLVFHKSLSCQTHYSQKVSLKIAFLCILPLFIKIGWDASSILLEKIVVNPASKTGIKLFLICLSVSMLIGYNEELIWRKLIYNRIAECTEFIKAAFISSALFGLCHFENIMSGQNISQCAIQVVTAFCIGIFQCSLYQYTQKLIPIVIIHGLYNLSNFYFNEIVGWKYQGYWWDIPIQVLYSVLFLGIGMVMIKRYRATESKDKINVLEM